MSGVVTDYAIFIVVGLNQLPRFVAAPSSDHLLFQIRSSPGPRPAYLQIQDVFLNCFFNQSNRVLLGVEGSRMARNDRDTTTPSSRQNLDYYCSMCLRSQIQKCPGWPICLYPVP